MAETRKEALFLGDIRKTYHTGTFDVPVLKGVNFEIWKGEFIGIMGSSGSGKSTLLNILGLLDKPSSGVYRLDGISVETLSDYELTSIRNIKIGFVFQAFNLFPHLTVQENIEVPMVYAGVPKNIRNKVSAEMAEKVRLAHRLDHRPTQLSGGECQRVAVARSLVNNPTFILADEPTGNLDEKTGNEIMTLFHDLHKAGTTIVMVTHNPQYEPEYDRVIYLRNGRKWRIVDNVNNTREEFNTDEVK
ncbi:MAG: ABC transporter ATP-binding protein [Lentisphaeria bacterium]|nr:ABC transporter ATP-binding protein [Lentisphaeria bacterium]